VIIRHRIVVAFLVAALAAAGVAAAQRRRQGGGGFGFGYGRASVKMMTPEDYNGAFLFCRIIFRTTPDGDGGNWGVDYPRADINLTFRLSELTKTPVTRDERDGYNHVVIRMDDPLLYKCPFIMMTEVGNTYLDEAESTALRDYALKGGFLWADDFWGEYAWRIWAREIGKAFPPERYPIIDLPLEHQLFHVLYDIKHYTQIPSINFWGYTGGQTSERGADSAQPHVRAILDPDDPQRIMVLITHNTDFGDAFEREGDDHAYFLRFAPDGYAFGVNALVYSMTH